MPKSFQWISHGLGTKKNPSIFRPNMHFIFIRISNVFLRKFAIDYMKIYFIPNSSIFHLKHSPMLALKSFKLAPNSFQRINHGFGTKNNLFMFRLNVHFTFHTNLGRILKKFCDEFGLKKKIVSPYFVPTILSESCLNIQGSFKQIFFF